MLVAVAVISFLVGKLVDTIVVAVVIVFNSGIGFFQEYKAESALQSLKSMALIFLPGAPIVFTPVQILWVNLVTDGILDVTLAMEPKEEKVMDQPPRKPTAGIINREILLNIFYVGLFMMLGALWIFSQELSRGNIIKAQTLGFTTLAMFQVFNSLNCRSRTKLIFKLGLLSNKYLLLAIITSIFLQALTTVWPPLQFALGTTHLTIREWSSIVLVSSSIFFADEIRKLVINRFKN